MSRFCTRCQTDLLPLGYKANFCPFCATVAPVVTFPKLEPPELTDAVYCPRCSQANPQQAQYCMAEGGVLHQRPTQGSWYCPYCKTELSGQLEHCPCCRGGLSDWFQMRGTVAGELGHPGPIHLYHSATDHHYHLWVQLRLTMGRGAHNDVAIPLRRISGNHGVIDMAAGLYRDQSSSNGSYCNQRAERIETTALHHINELNLGGCLTYRIIQGPGLFGLQLREILDRKSMQHYPEWPELEQQQQHSHLLIEQNAKAHIDLENGRIDAGHRPGESLNLTWEAGYLYLSCRSHQLAERLFTLNQPPLPSLFKNLSKVPQSQDSRA